jgi:MATE family multidrug resistance protein
MALAACVFLLLPRPILHIYTHDDTVVVLGTRLLMLAAAFQIFDGIQTVATGALRGAGETRQPMFVNLGGYWFFGLPLGYALCFHAQQGVFGIWVGLTISLIVIAMYLLWEWSRKSHRMMLRLANAEIGRNTA